MCSAKVLLRFWSREEQGCWTALLSAGPVEGRGSAFRSLVAIRLALDPGPQLCVLVHDLLRIGLTRAPEDRVLEVLELITKARPSAVLDRCGGGGAATSL